MWEPSGRPPRADRLFRQYASAVPPLIGSAHPAVTAATAAALEDAVAEIVRLDTLAAGDFAGLAGALLRSESVASSRIERLEATSTELGIAALRSGNRRTEATVVLRNVEAMQHAITLADRDRRLGVDGICEIHRMLMRDDPHDADEAGIVRREQNWVGGSDHSPRDALFVPPDPERLPGLLADLATFLDRVDLSTLVQAFVAHAQFETIHPFVDGNGRTGRALIHTVLRRRGLARQVAVPASAALLADTSAYFASLDAYRAGDLDGYLSHVATQTARAAREAGRLAAEWRDVRTRWETEVRPQPGSVAAAVLELLARQPVIDADSVAGVTDANKSSLYRALDSLTDLGVIAELTGDRRHRIWAAVELVEAVDSFVTRLGRRRASG